MIYICSTQAKKAVDSKPSFDDITQGESKAPATEPRSCFQRLCRQDSMSAPQNESGSELTKSTHSGVKPSMTWVSSSLSVSYNDSLVLSATPQIPTLASVMTLTQ